MTFDKLILEASSRGASEERSGWQAAAYPGRSPEKEESKSQKDLIEVVHHGRRKSSS